MDEEGTVSCLSPVEVMIKKSEETIGGKIRERILLYLLRKKGRSLLLAVLFLATSVLILTGLALKKSADAQNREIRRNLGSSFTVSADVNNEGLYEPQTDKSYLYSLYVGPVVTPKLLEELEQFEGLAGCEVDSNALVWVDYKLRPGAWTDKDTAEWDDYPESQESGLFWRHVINVFICHNGSLNSYFRTGTFSISEGRNIEESDEGAVVISEYVAKKNDFSVGDTIRLEEKEGMYGPVEAPETALGEPLEVTIVGIFAVHFEQEPSEYTYEDQYAENVIFTDTSTGLKLKRIVSGDGYQPQYYKVTFFVDSPEALPDVMERVEEHLSGSGLLIEQDDVAYRSTVKPLKAISLFATVLLVIGVVGSTVILYLVLTLWIRGRGREIGILLSVGEPKKRIVLQFAGECLAVATLSLAAALISYPALTRAAFRIAETATEPENSEEAYSVYFDLGTTGPQVDKVSTEAVKLDDECSAWDALLVVVVVYLIGGGTVLFVSVRMVKKPPRKLLQTL